MSSALLSLLDAFVAQAAAEHKAWIGRAVSMARAMIEEGEADIALENFCENLLEWQCPISRDLYATLQQQANALGVEASVVAALNALVK